MVSGREQSRLEWAIHTDSQTCQPGPVQLLGSGAYSVNGTLSAALVGSGRVAHGGREMTRVLDTTGGGGRWITDREPNGADTRPADTSWNIVGSKRVRSVYRSDILVDELKRPIAVTTAPRSSICQPSSSAFDILNLVSMGSE